MDATIPSLCSAQMQVFWCLLRVAIFSLLSLSLAVLKWSTLPATSMGHTCSSSHLSPREAERGHGTCVLQSHSLAGSWACRLSFPLSKMDGKAKTPVLR